MTACLSACPVLLHLPWEGKVSCAAAPLLGVSLSVTHKRCGLWGDALMLWEGVVPGRVSYSYDSELGFYGSHMFNFAVSLQHWEGKGGSIKIPYSSCCHVCTLLTLTPKPWPHPDPSPMKAGAREVALWEQFAGVVCTGGQSKQHTSP